MSSPAVLPTAGHDDDCKLELNTTATAGVQSGEAGERLAFFCSVANHMRSRSHRATRTTLVISLETSSTNAPNLIWKYYKVLLRPTFYAA